MIDIVKTGLYAHWVDSGRYNAQRHGYSQSGALDWLHYALANALCGNQLTTPCIEVLGGNIAIKLQQSCWVSVTGASAKVSVNHHAIAINSACWVNAGSTLTIDNLSAGWVNYIGFAVPMTQHGMYNSVCRVKREMASDAWLNQMRLTGDHASVQFTAAKSNDRTQRETLAFSPQYSAVLQQFFANVDNIERSEAISIPVQLSYQSQRFDLSAQSIFFTQEYSVSAQFDRMGLRLEGAPITCSSHTLSSQAIAFGAIQITGAGLPIVMRNDRQTIGGYPVIGTVSRVGMAMLAQASSGQKIVFVPSNIDDNLWHYQRCAFALLAICDGAKQHLAANELNAPY